MYTVVAGNRKRGIGYRIYEGGNVLVRVGQRVLRQRVGNPPDGQLVETLEQAIELAESLPDSPDAIEWYDSDELGQFVLQQLGCKTDLEFQKFLFTRRAAPDRNGNRVVLGYYFNWNKELLFVPGPNDCVVYRAEKELPMYDKCPYTFMWNKYGTKCR